jgi:hypothetical protein
VIKIAISQAAFDAVAKTLPLGTVAFEAWVTPTSERVIYLDDREADKLDRCAARARVIPMSF